MEAIRAYIERIKNIPVLSAQEERKLLRQAKKQNREAYRKLINSNLKLVINIAKHYARFGLPLMDLIEEGNIGIIKAIAKFNLRKGYRFSTYASWWIRQAITRALTEQSRLIRIPVYMSELMSHYVKGTEELRQLLNREPTKQELAKKLKISQERLSNIELRMNKKSSLDAPVGDEGDSQLSDFIKTEGEADTEGEIDSFFKHQNILDLFHELSERDALILDMRFGISSGKAATLAEVSKKLKISRERVRQLEERALKKLRAVVKEHNISSL